MTLKYGLRAIFFFVTLLTMFLAGLSWKIRSVSKCNSILKKIDTNVELENIGYFRYPTVVAIKLNGGDDLYNWMQHVNHLVSVQKMHVDSCVISEKHALSLVPISALSFSNCTFLFPDKSSIGFLTKNALSFVNCGPTTVIDTILRNSRTGMLNLIPKEGESNGFLGRDLQFASVFSTRENLLQNSLDIGTEYWQVKNGVIEKFR